MNNSEIYRELSLQIDKSKILPDAPMKEFTSFKAGGNAAFLVRPGNITELSKTVEVLKRCGMKRFIMGNGTNLLVKDTGYSGAIIKLAEGFDRIEITETSVFAGAGALLSAAAQRASEESLTGFEFAAGIPGSMGGAVFMNAGAYDGEMSQIISEVFFLPRDGGEVCALKKGEMALSYRHSIFQETGDIIIGVTLRLKKGNKEEIKERMAELAARRSEKQPLNLPSAGSFFKRPPGNFAGRLIHEAGLRGLSSGGAQVSPLHAGFIVNAGGATAEDIINLMEVVRNTVYDKSGIMLAPEVKIIGD